MLKKRLTIDERRKNRVRLKIKGQSTRPRLTVFRSNKYIYAQIIDDMSGKTLVAVNQKEVASKEKIKKIDQALTVGKLIAEKAKKAKISKVVFDKGSFSYLGRVKSLAQGARDGGLEF